MKQSIAKRRGHALVDDHHLKKHSTTKSFLRSMTRRMSGSKGRASKEQQHEDMLNSAKSTPGRVSKENLTGPPDAKKGLKSVFSFSTNRNAATGGGARMRSAHD